MYMIHRFLLPVGITSSFEFNLEVRSFAAIRKQEVRSIAAIRKQEVRSFAAIRKQIVRSFAAIRKQKVRSFAAIRKQEVSRSALDSTTGHEYVNQPAQVPELPTYEVTTHSS